MNRQIVIDWRVVLPINDIGWRDSVDYVIADLQEEHGRVLRPASHSDDLIDILFVAYMAVDHERIVEDGLLHKRLTSLGSAMGTLVLVACDITNRDTDIDNESVRELLIRQASDFGSDQHAFRSPTVELFRDQTRACIGSHIRRARLINYHDEAPDATVEASPTTTGPNLLRAEYL